MGITVVWDPGSGGLYFHSRRREYKSRLLKKGKSRTSVLFWRFNVVGTSVDSDWILSSTSRYKVRSKEGIVVIWTDRPEKGSENGGQTRKILEKMSQWRFYIE